MDYPIKYAVEELKVDGGINYEYEDITKGFIVSKCYVLEDRLIYLPNGETCQKFVVSFPYDQFEYFTRWFRQNSYKYMSYIYDLYKNYIENKHDPSREHLRDGHPLHFVCELFDDFLEAKEMVDHKNNQLKGEILANTGRKAYEKLLKEFDDTMTMCGEYEKFIFANTSDMLVDKGQNAGLIRKLTR